MTERLFPTKVFISVDEAASAGFFTPKPTAADIVAPTNTRKVFDCRFSLDDPLNYGRNQYLKNGHIPNAIFIDLDTEMSAQATSTTGRHPLPIAKDFVATLAKAGIASADTACVCYDDQSGGLAAARLWWMLNNLGIEAYILDGGIKYYREVSEYIAEKQKQSTAAAATTNNTTEPNLPLYPVPLITASLPNIVLGQLKPTTAMTKDIIASWPFKFEWTHIVDGEDVKRIYFNDEQHAEVKSSDKNNNSRNNNRPIYLDARFAHRFGSTTRPFGGDKFAGSVPHSVCRPWNANIAPPAAASTTAEMNSSRGSTSSLELAVRATQENPTDSSPSPSAATSCPSLRKRLSKIPILRPTATLRHELSAFLPPTKSNFNDAIFSCASGVTACMNIAVASHVGLGVPKLYAGAWSEVEAVNKKFLANRSHAKNGGYRLDMIKKLPSPANGTRVTNVEKELKITRTTPVGCLSFSRLDAELVNKVAKELFLGEVADVYVKEEGYPKEVLVGRIEAVKVAKL